MAMSYFLHQRPPAIAEMLLLLFSVRFLHVTGAEIGVCYGTLGDNLPSPAQVIDLCNRHNIKGIRIYNPNPLILQALNGNPSIAVLVGVPNEELPAIAGNPATARSWVENNIFKYPNSNIRYIVAGNEISPSSNLARYVGPAIENIFNVISGAGRGDRIKVTTSINIELLGQSYPPSAAAFKPEASPFINPIVQLLLRTNSPLLVNVYPYLAYSGNSNTIRLDYAIFTAPTPVFRDGIYEYQNLFDAMVDATYVALEKIGGANLRIVVSETGWPSAGGIGATVDNARIYNSNLIQHVNKGTPRRAGKPIEFYIFDLIDENQKTPEFEKHWGLFLPNLQPKYPIPSRKHPE